MLFFIYANENPCWILDIPWINPTLLFCVCPSYEVETDPMLTTRHQIRNPKGIKICLHAIVNVLVETLIFVSSKEHQGLAKKAYTVNYLGTYKSKFHF